MCRIQASFFFVFSRRFSLRDAPYDPDPTKGCDGKIARALRTHIPRPKATEAKRRTGRRGEQPKRPLESCSLSPGDMMGDLLGWWWM